MLMLQRQGTVLWVASLPTRAEENARRTEMWEAWSAAGRIHPSVSSALSVFEARRKMDR